MKPILFGNSEGYNDTDRVIDSVLSALGSTRSAKEVEDVLDKHGLDYDENLKSEINAQIEKCFTQNCDKCEDCIYKKYYFEHCENSSKIASEEEKVPTFYQEIKSQIDKLFAQNQAEEYLQNLLPNSKWVKVEVDGEGNYYVLGLLYEEDMLKFICYGVPGVYQKSPPSELSGYPVWFPLDQEKPDGFGYWLSYQDADSGESIKAIVE